MSRDDVLKMNDMSTYCLMPNLPQYLLEYLRSSIQHNGTT